MWKIMSNLIIRKRRLKYFRLIFGFSTYNSSALGFELVGVGFPPECEKGLYLPLQKPVLFFIG